MTIEQLTEGVSKESIVFCIKFLKELTPKASRYNSIRVNDKGELISKDIGDAIIFGTKRQNDHEREIYLSNIDDLEKVLNKLKNKK
jgi:hypothetical protein